MDIIVIALAICAIVVTILLIYILAQLRDKPKYHSNSYPYHTSSKYKDAIPVSREQSNSKQETPVIDSDVDSESHNSELVSSEQNLVNDLGNNNNANEGSENQGKKLSHKQQLRLQKKEEKALKKAEEARRREELAEETRKRNFNPKLSIPSGAKFTNLAVSGGHLNPSSIGQTSYYRCWEYEGAFYYEFYCEPSKAPKAFNNRSVILDPFCQKDNDSVSVDSAKTFTTLEYGVMDSNFNIISKSLVKFE